MAMPDARASLLPTAINFYSVNSDHDGMLRASIESATRVLESLDIDRLNRTRQSLLETRGTYNISAFIKEAVDPKTKLTYYYNSLTRESFWNDPRLAWPSRNSPVSSKACSLGPADGNKYPVSSHKDGASESPTNPATMPQNHQKSQLPDPERIKRDLHLLKLKTCKGATDISLDSMPVSMTPVEVPSSPAKVCLRKSGCNCEMCTTMNSAITEPMLSVQSRTKPLQQLDINSSKPLKQKDASPTESPNLDITRTSTRPKWKRKSNELRQSIPQNTKADGKEPHAKPELGVNTAGFIQCPHCERRFNEKAAERHIPKCNDIKYKPKTLLKGEGRSAFCATRFAKQRPNIPDNLRF